MARSRVKGDWITLSDSACVVAGGSGLIGRASSRALLDLGAKVWNLDRLNCDDPPTSFIKTNLSKESSVKRAFLKLDSETFETWNFIYSAYPRTKSWNKLGFENVTIQDWNKNVELQLGSAFLFAHCAARFLKRKKLPGQILFLGSIYGLGGPDWSIYKDTGMENPAPYAAIKAGLVGLTKYIATRFGGLGIRCNLIAPGGIENGQSQKFRRNYARNTPMGRMAQPEEIGQSIALFCCSGLSYCNGAIIPIDGGWTAK